MRVVRSIGLAILELSILLSTVTAAGQRPVVAADKLRTITTVREAHSLSAEDAKRGYPVHVQAVVTYFDPYNDGVHASLFVHDATGAIFVLVPAGFALPGQTLRSGSMVDIVGISAPGDYAALITHAQIRVTGQTNSVIPAKQASLTQILTGAEDAQVVQVEGVVHSISESVTNVTVNLALADGMIGAITVKQAGVDYAGLIDARVRLKANVGTLFNANRQMIGSHLLFPGLESMTVLDLGPRDIMASPVRSIDGLSRFTLRGNLHHRVHLRGRVTLQWPGNLVCIQDDADGICTNTAQTTHFERGELVEVAGFTASGGYKPALVDGVFRGIGAAKPVIARPVSAEQALEGKLDAEPIQIEGRVLGRELRAKQLTLLLSAGENVFPVVLPANLASSEIARIRNGSKVRVTGICSVLLDTQKMASGGGAAVVKSFQVMLRSPADVVVLETPSWWTSAHATLVLSVAFGATVLVTAWVIVLRKRVEHQTRVIRESEDRFRHMAQHDSLTGLPTRALLHHRLGKALEDSRRSHTGIALLMLDLDAFKEVNDLLGHLGGDRTLCMMANRIQAAIRKTDLVARMGGDEFIVLIEDLLEPEQAELVAAKIIAALSEPIQVEEQEVVVSVSIGVCTIFDSVTDADVLLKSVDTAMYEAKANGRNCFRVFNDEMASATAARRKLREGLAHALERREFEIYYQPLVACQTGELEGFEALLRWRSNELGMIMPTDFIPIAEESGMIIPIGEWVLREACRQIGLMERQLGRRFTLAVNVSPRQLLQREIPEVIRQTLRETGRPPEYLKMEITENILMTDSINVQNALLRIHDLGVQLAIDDFGIGFSSLSYISRFPVQWIKIDRSFVGKCTTDISSLAVVRAIITMAHSLDIRVVAEGVENAEQLSLMRIEECDEIQGYYFSRPVPFSGLTDLIASFDSNSALRLKFDAPLAERKSSTHGLAPHWV